MNPTPSPTPDTAALLPEPPGTLSPREALSALADGHADSSADAGPAALAGDGGDLREAWASYHLIGEAMRGGPAAAMPADARFVRAVMAGIAAEGGSLGPVGRAAPAANSTPFHWQALGALALVVLAGLAVWNSGLPGLVAEPVTVAGSASAPAAVATAPALPTPASVGVLIRDPQLEALLAEHRQYGSVSALHAPAGFLRASVSVSEP